MNLFLPPLFLISLLFFSTGCAPKSEDVNATTVSPTYIFANARLVPTHTALNADIYEDENRIATVGVNYAQSEDKNITFNIDATKRLITVQDEENNQSLSTFDDKRLIYLSVGNDDDNNHDVPVSLDGPTKDELSNSNFILKVYNAMVMEDGDKFVVLEQNEDRDYTNKLGYKDQTLGWVELTPRTNSLYEIYKVSTGGFVDGPLNVGQDVFTMDAEKAYMMVIYEDASNVDVPYIMLIDVTPKN